MVTYYLWRSAYQNISMTSLLDLPSSILPCNPDQDLRQWFPRQRGPSACHEILLLHVCKSPSLNQRFRVCFWSPCRVLPLPVCIFEFSLVGCVSTSTSSFASSFFGTHQTAHLKANNSFAGLLSDGIILLRNRQPQTQIGSRW